jgi:hypothetical protein
LRGGAIHQPDSHTLNGLDLTHPDVGPVTALATDALLAEPSRFADGKALVRVTVGMILANIPAGASRGWARSATEKPLLRSLCAAREAFHAVHPLSDQVDLLVSERGVVL